MPASRRPSPVRGLVTGLALALLGAALPALATPSYAADPARADVTAGLLLRYDLTQTSGTVVTDSSGNGRNGTLAGGGTWGGESGLTLDGVDDHVKLPDNLTAGLSSITVSADVLIDPTQAGNYFIWGLGNPAVGSPASGSGYLMATGNTFRATITNQWWNNEKNTAPSPGRNLARGVWKTVTYTQTGTTGTLFEDGVQVGQNTNVTVLPSAIGNGVTTNNVLGESNYAADNTLKGRLKNFRVYDRALSPTEVSDIALTDANRLAADTTALSLGDTSAVTDDLTLPTTGPYGSTIAWASSDTGTIATDGTVTRPAATAEARTVTLTATLTRGTAGSSTRAFTATVLPEEGDQAKADAAAAAITLVHADDVRGHLTLPTTSTLGSTVAWASSAPTLVGTTGLVTRPEHGAGDATATLTATVTVGSATATRAFPLTVREKPAPAAYEGYAFSYFTGNSIAGEKIYFAASRGNNALRWDELNGGQPTLESTFGERGLRDPFLIRSPEGDRFFLIATDLSIGRNGDWDRSQRQGSRYLEVWESTDLINWSPQRHVLVSPETAGNTWAPEAYWDDQLQQYVVFWASKLYATDDPGHTGNTYNRMLYVTTRDFTTFSQPQIWQDRGESRIDSTVIKDGATYYRFTKDEGGGGTGCSDIIQERASSLTAVDLPGNPSWEFMQACIGRDAGTSAVEGPSIFKANPGDTSGNRFYLFVDEYGGRGYIPLGTDDLATPDWTVPSSYKLPASPRHGTVIPVTAAELAALRADLPAPPTPVQADADGLVAHYPLSGDAQDTSGHDYDATVAGGASFADGSLGLDGTDDHVRLPDNIMAGLEQVTVSLDVWVDPTQPTPYFLYGLGNSAGGAGNGYLFTTGNAYRSSITLGNFSGEQTATSGADLARGAWKTLTYTLDGSGTARIYLDGVQVGTRTGVTVKPGEIGDGRTTANYIGRSLYSGDRYLQGRVRDFSLYDRALSADEVADLALDFEGTQPVASVSDAGSDGWSGADAALSFTTDASVVSVDYRLPGGEWTTYDEAVALPAGEYDVAYRARGVNLQWSQEWSLAVKVDDVLPESSALLADRTVTLTATDADSGVAGLDYRVDGGAWLPYTAPVVLDAGAHILDHRASDVAGNTSAARSLAVAAAPAPTATVVPRITGTPTVGTLLRATAGAWDRSGLTFSYQWLRDGRPVGVDAASYRLGAADVGHRISVVVTATAEGLSPGTATSAATRPVAKLRGSVKAQVAARPVAGRPVPLTIRLGNGQAGRVQVRVDGRLVRTVAVTGTQVVRLTFRPGRHVVKVAYLGSATTTAASATTTVRARQR